MAVRGVNPVYRIRWLKSGPIDSHFASYNFDPKAADGNESLHIVLLVTSRP